MMSLLEICLSPRSAREILGEPEEDHLDSEMSTTDAPDNISDRAHYEPDEEIHLLATPANLSKVQGGYSTDMEMSTTTNPDYPQDTAENGSD